MTPLLEMLYSPGAMKSTDSLARRAARGQIYTAFAIVALTVLAAGLRLWALDLAPQALYRDEAQNGLDALQVLNGARPIYFEANNGREPLFIYLAALSIALLGRTPSALRIVSVLCGTLTVPALYWLGSEVRDRCTGLWAAALAVSTVWLLNLSRVAFRAGLLPLLGALALASLLRAQRLRSTAWAIGAGALLGACAYTYLAARAIPLVLALYLLWCLLDRRVRAATWWRGWALILLLAVLTSAPLVTHLWRTDALLSRSDQVSILNPAINGGDLSGTLARNLFRTLRALVYGGDFIPRHNVPWRAVFTPAIALAAYGGLGILAWRSRKDAAPRLILLWLVCLALPTILAEGAPHFLRGAGVLPAVMLLPAVGLQATLDHVRLPWRRGMLALVLAAVLWGSWADWSAYREHLSSAPVYFEFETGAAELAAEINRQLGSGWQGAQLMMEDNAPGPTTEVWIARRLWDGFPSIQFLVSETERVTLLEEGEAAPHTEGNDVLAALWPYADHAALWAALPFDWEWEVAPGAWEQGDLDPEPRLLYITLRGRPTGVVTSDRPARFEGGISLVDAGISASTELTNIDVTFRWRADERPTEELSVFVHAVCDSELVGQADGAPAGEWFPTTVWRPGDVIMDRRTLALEVPWDPMRCEIRAGLYRWQDGTRLPIVESGDWTTEDDAAILGSERLKED